MLKYLQIKELQRHIPESKRLQCEMLKSALKSDKSKSTDMTPNETWKSWKTLVWLVKKLQKQYLVLREQQETICIKTNKNIIFKVNESIRVKAESPVTKIKENSLSTKEIRPWERPKIYQKSNKLLQWIMYWKELWNTKKIPIITTKPSAMSKRENPKTT